MSDPISNDVTQSTIDWSIVSDVPARLEIPEIGTRPQAPAIVQLRSDVPDFILIDRKQLEALLQLVKVAQAAPEAAVASTTALDIPETAAPPPPPPPSMSAPVALPGDPPPPPSPAAPGTPPSAVPQPPPTAVPQPAPTAVPPPAPTAVPPPPSPPSAAPVALPGAAPVLVQAPGDPRNAAPIAQVAMSSTETPVPGVPVAQLVDTVPSVTKPPGVASAQPPVTTITGGADPANPAVLSADADLQARPSDAVVGTGEQALSAGARGATEQTNANGLTSLLERLVESTSRTVFGSSLMRELATPGKTVSPQMQVFTNHAEGAVKAFFVQEGTDAMRVVMVDADLSVDGSQTARAAAKVVAKALNEAISRAFDGEAPMKAKVSLQDGAVVIQWVRTKGSQQQIRAGELANNMGYQLFAQPEDKAAQRPSLFRLAAPLSYLDEFEAAIAHQQQTATSAHGGKGLVLGGMAAREPGVHDGMAVRGDGVAGGAGLRNADGTQGSGKPGGGAPIGFDAATQHAGLMSAWSAALPIQAMVGMVGRFRGALFGTAAILITLYVVWSDPSQSAEAIVALCLLAVTLFGIQLWKSQAVALFALRWPLRMPFPILRASVRYRTTRLLGRKEPKEFFVLACSPAFRNRRRQMLQAGGTIPAPPSFEEAFAQLGVPVASPWPAVVAAFRIGVRRMHPDTGSSPDVPELDQLVQSYAVLRAAYRHRR